MKEFYLSLPSDSSLDTFPDNKQSKFTIRLDHPIEIDKQNWEMALAEIITPAELNTTNDYNIFFFMKTKAKAPKKIWVESLKPVRLIGNYVTPQHLVKTIQESFDAKYKDQLRDRFNLEVLFTYGNNSKNVKVGLIETETGDAKNQCLPYVHIVLPKPVGEILGVEPGSFGESVKNARHKFKHGVDLNAYNNRFYAYSDVASFTLIGGMTAPLLRVVPFKHKEKDIHFHHEFLNLHYVPVAKSFIDHILIKGDTGEDISFITGKTLIKLHFRLRE